MRFSSGNVVGQLTINITENDIHNIIVQGIDFFDYSLSMSGELWKGRPRNIKMIDWATMLVLEGQYICFIDEDGEYSDELKLTLPKLLKGIRLAYIEYSDEFNVSNISKHMASEIIRFTLFGTNV